MRVYREGARQLGSQYNIVWYLVELCVRDGSDGVRGFGLASDHLGGEV